MTTVSNYDFNNLSESKKARVIKLLQDQKKDGLFNVTLYPWQHKFNTATLTHRQCLLMAANRIGKTMVGTYLDAIHATGRYPDDWTGYRYTVPPLLWVMGYSGDKCRDILQSAIFGSYSRGEFSGGLISTNYIKNSLSSGVPGLAQVVFVKWKGPKGEEGISEIHFKSYSQGQHALMGDEVDWFHIDEEPKDHTIWPQVLTRTASADQGKGGRGILTFTPENGKTQLVTKFMDDIGKGQYLQTATWNDAPHLSKEVKEELLESFPKSQRRMRTEGYPLMGSGLIYEISDQDIMCDAFDIPQHWIWINAIDFGLNHPQAHIQLVWDPTTSTYYVTQSFKASDLQPYEAWNKVKEWAKHIPTAWPHDGLQREKGSAKTTVAYYRKEGFCMLPDHATWEEGGNGVEAGLMQINNLMKEGQFKVFRNLDNWFEEKRQYHKKDAPNNTSKIVKVNDDLLDATRYAFMMIQRHGDRVMDRDGESEQEYYDYRRDQTADDQDGY